MCSNRLDFCLEGLSEIAHYDWIIEELLEKNITYVR